MCQAATNAGIDPDRIKFIGTVRIVRRSVTERAAFPPEDQEALLTRTLERVASHRNLNPRRRQRTYPRSIKRPHPSGYRERRRSDRGIRHPGPPTVKLLPSSTRAHPQAI